MALDLDILAEILPYRPFKLGGFVVGVLEAHRAVDFKIEADGDPTAHLLNREVVNSETVICGDQHHLLIDRLIIERDGIGGDRHVGIGKGRFDRRGNLIPEPHHVVHRHGAPDAEDDTDEQGWAGRPHSETFDGENALETTNDIANSVARALRCCIKESVESTVAEPHCGEEHDPGDQKRRNRVRPKVACPHRCQSDEDGNGAPHIR